MRRLLLATTLLLPLPALSDDVALLLGQERYEQLDRVSRADDILLAQDRLEGLGFTVLGRSNGRIGAVRDLAATFQQDVAGAERLVVALTGHFVTDGARTWLLSAEATAPDLFSVDQAGLSLESLLQVLAQRQGKAVLLLGAGDAGDLDMDDSALRAGIGALDVPAGVTIIRTTPIAAADLLSGALSEPEAQIGAQLLSDRDLQIEGFMPMDWVLMPELAEIQEPVVETGPTEQQLTAEATLWDQTTTADTVEAYRTYVARYPEGRFIAVAEEQIEAILAEPNRAARLAEEALGLTRAARRDVQADLTLLEYNTRGVDGIFGPGSRRAITNWQQSNGFPQTSYVTQNQISLLDAQAARRQAEIDAEEAEARARAQALDREYWAETGSRGDEPGYRAYLDRYPEGVFASIARARLGEIDEQRQAETDAADRQAWARAETENTVPSYQEYLAAYPAGLFSQEAGALISQMTGEQASSEQTARAQAEESQLRLSGVRAQLLELRLRELGHNPGRLDGVVDENTRTAIAAYQRQQGIAVTGYVDRETAVGLLSGSISITVPGR